MIAEQIAQRELRLLKTIRCLNCWQTFRPQEALWVSEHMELMGDVLLGSEFQRRFRAMRFTLQGDALDSRGTVCTELACPHCHLSVPRVLLSYRPLFCSLLGCPSSGKSYYLGALSYKLRRLFPGKFALDFTDTDHISNGVLSSYEQSLFLQPDPDKLLALNELIPKTQLTGQLYNRVMQGNQTTLFPRPFSFLLSPMDRHPNTDRRDAISRTVCLYDNAGEHFLPGQDTSVTPATRHLSVSDFVLFLFDPLQDPRFVNRLANESSAPDRYRRQIGQFKNPIRQELVLRECRDRMTKYRRAENAGEQDVPLLVVVTKMDEWKGLIPSLVTSEKAIYKKSGATHRLALDPMRRNSDLVRELLQNAIPELVTAAEAFSRHVTYVPVTALGNPPELDNKGVARVLPRNLMPTGVEIPFLYGLSKTTRGLVSAK